MRDIHVANARCPLGCVFHLCRGFELTYLFTGQLPRGTPVVIPSYQSISMKFTFTHCTDGHLLPIFRLTRLGST